jgi:hypothetical protein
MARTELGWVPQGQPLLDELVQGSYRRIWGPKGLTVTLRTAGRITEAPGHFTAGRRGPEQASSENNRENTGGQD